MRLPTTLTANPLHYLILASVMLYFAEWSLADIAGVSVNTLLRLVHNIFACVALQLEVNVNATCIQINLYALLVTMQHRQTIVNQALVIPSYHWLLMHSM